MALQSSGQISIRDVNVELGNRFSVSPTTPMGMDDYRFRDLYNKEKTLTTPSNGTYASPFPQISLADGYSKSVYPVDIDYWIIGAGGGGGAGHGAYVGGAGSNGSAGGTTSISSSAFATISATGGGGGLAGVTISPPVTSVNGDGGPGVSLDILPSEIDILEAGPFRVTQNDTRWGQGRGGGYGPGANQYYSYSGGGGGGGGGAGGAGSPRQGGSTQAAAAQYKTGTISNVPQGTVITITIGLGGAGGAGNPSYYGGSDGFDGSVRLKIGSVYYSWLGTAHHDIVGTHTITV